ncbi:MAG: hypothetical protein EHM35_02055 [Planctomycetaceae bacterium]|nr:MAG: hypothetical protein EHM35_02055 [Planctomycetaceae bacterium]
MTVIFTKGDIFLTPCQVIGVGLSANGRLGVTPFHTALHDRYPVFISECGKRGRAGTLPPGTLWVWRDGIPWLAGLVVQETPHAPARLRTVEAALLNLWNDGPREGITSLALMRFGDDSEWPALRGLLNEYLSRLPLPVIVYDEYLPGVAAEDE